MEKFPFYLNSKTSKSHQQNISASHSEAAVRRCSSKQVLLMLHHIYRKTPVLRSLFKKLYLKETPAQVFSCEYCGSFKKSFFHGTPTVAASGLYHYLSKLILRRPFSYFLTLTILACDLEKQPFADIFQKRCSQIFANLAGNTCVGVFI